MNGSLEEVEAILGYTFKDKSLLALGLTHSSYANDYLGGPTKGNERLEFLGDAILDMVVSAELYDRFPEKQEGFLSMLPQRSVHVKDLLRSSPLKTAFPDPSGHPFPGFPGA